MDFEKYFEMYESLVRQADTAFKQVQFKFSQCVRCKVACSDCCHALFDLTLIEALYINHRFNHTLCGKIREILLEKANSADREVYQLKRKAYKAYQKGQPESDILTEMAAQRVRCPMLNEQEHCDIYEFRPITCRLYGIPTVIGGRSHTCGLSGFEQGEAYPTVKLDIIQRQLYEISSNLAKAIKSRYSGLAEMLVPLSMALITEYSEVYLGVKTSEKDEKQQKEDH